MRWIGLWHELVRSSRLVWSICAILIAAIFLGAGLLAWELRKDTLVDNQQDTTALGFVLSEQMSRYLQVIDLMLEDVQAYGASSVNNTPDALRKRFATAEAYTFLSSRLRNLPQAHALTFIDVNGTITGSSRSFPPPPVNVADRDFFQYFREHPDDPNVFISAPAISRVTGTPTLYMVRSVLSPDHAFLGVLTAAIDIPYLQSFFGAIHLQSGRTVTVLRRDGLVLVRHPSDEGTAGKRMPASSQWYKRVAEGGGIYRSPGLFSGGPALVSVHPLRRYPVVVDSAILTDEVLALWRRQAILLAAGAAAAAAAVLALFTVIARQVRRLAERNATLAETAAALGESERRVRDFAEVSSDWFWEQDANLRFTWLSQTSPSERLNDHSYRGKTRQQLLRVDETDPGWKAHQLDLNAHRPFRDFRYQRVTADGGVIHVSVSGMPVFDAEGNFLGYRGTGRNITAQVETEHALREAKEHAEAANRAKSEFLATMSHELRTPLNAIIGFSELIRDKACGSIPDAYVDFAKDINASGKHLLELINDVLDLSRIEGGHYELHEEVMLVTPLLRSCTAMLGPRARDADLVLECHAPAATVAMRADRRAVRQVLLTLLENAVKFTPAHGNVSASLEPQPDGSVALVVADTGIGIAPDKMAELGEPFHQADASIRRRFGGTGLGLAISRKLVALHGGRLEITSRLGHGTTVRAIFPPERVTMEAQPVLS